MIVPHHFTLWQAASSPSTQAFLLIGFAFGAVVKTLVPWLWLDDKVRAAWRCMGSKNR
jgi:cytochrome bd-type quinol oxidase subunit 2